MIRLLPFLMVALITGCSSVTKVRQIPNWKAAAEREVDPLPVPNRFGPFQTCQKLNPVFWFGNSDEPTAPEWYLPDDPRRDWKWRVRNPFHNFTFYVLGIADTEFTRVGPHPEHVFDPDGGWNWAVSRASLLPLPFVSYRGERTQFYFGWRERGNFGIKLTR